MFGASSFSFSTPAASAAPGLFGGAAAANNPFGTSAAAGNPFGAPAAGSNPFGTPAAAATPSPFGAAPAAATTPSLFGSTAPAAPSPFGAPAAPAFGAASNPFGAAAPASPSPFGAAFGASQPATTPSLFAQPQQQQQQQTSLFGNQMTPQVAGGAFGGLAAGQPDLAAIKEVEALKDAYVPGPGNHKYRFNTLLLNVVDNPAARVKPQGVDELAWREAIQRCGGAANPQGLWPVLATGLSDLLARRQAQEAALQERAQRLEALAAVARQLARRQDTLLRDRIEAVKRKQVELSQLLLRVMRHIDALEGRFAGAMGYYRSPASREVTQQLDQQLSQLEAQLGPSSGGLQRRVEAVAAAARLRAGGGARNGGIIAELEGRVTPGSLAAMFALLQQQNQALQALENVLDRDNRDLAIMLEEPSTKTNGPVAMS